MQNHSKSPWQGMGNKPEIASTSITFCSANCRILLFGKLNFCEVRFKIGKNKATKQNQNVTRNNISLALLIKVANLGMINGGKETKKDHKHHVLLREIVCLLLSANITCASRCWTEADRCRS